MNRFREIYIYMVAIIICSYFMLFMLHGVNIHIPFSYSGDSTLNGIIVKGIIENGWYLHNPNIGVPFGLDMNDFAMSDNFNFFLIKIISLISRNYAVVMNTFYLLTYFLTLFISIYVFRHFKFSPFTSIVASILYTFLPYHYLRGVFHLFLSAYYMIPLIFMVILWAWNQDWNRKRYIFSIVILLIVSSTGIYYAFFAAFFFAVVTLYKGIQHMSVKVMIAPILLVLVIGVGTILNLSPTLLYQMNNGKNGIVAIRSSGEAEFYGLKMTNLILPVSGHRIPLLAKLNDKYQRNTPIGSEPSSFLGFIGTVGFILLLFSLFLKSGLLRTVSLLNISAYLLASIGGIGSMIALIALPEIRGYNRICVYIAFFSLFAIFYLMEKYIKRKYLYIVLSIVLICGLFDQVTKGFNPNNDASRNSFKADEVYIKTIEQSVPKGSMIFQLPYVPFPENPPVYHMMDYELAKPYLHSSNLRWSYGSMKGRLSDLWNQNESKKPTNELIDDLVYANFNGIYINRTGYVDNAVTLESEISNKLQEKPIENEDRTLAFYDLSDYSKEVKSKAVNVDSKVDGVLHQIFQLWGNGFSGLEGNADGNWRWSDSLSELNLVNNSDHNREVKIEMTFFTAYPEKSSLIFSGVISDSIQISANATNYTKELTLKSGNNRIKFKTNARQVVATGDPRRLFFRVANFKVIEK